jgi:hypothetical protein
MDGSAAERARERTSDTGVLAARKRFMGGTFNIQLSTFNLELIGPRDLIGSG